MPCISIIGASGAVGTTLASQILRSSLLNAGDRLQLVAREAESSPAKLLSVRIDLMDAFDDEGVDIEVVANIEDVDGDIVVICAGISSGEKLIDRRNWGRSNLALYQQIAEVCAQRLPDSKYIIVSNPVELAVRIFSEKLGRERVIGMGAEQDSLRFSRAIAHDLVISRHHVCASVLGEHGQAMVPLWSSIELGILDPCLQDALAEMRAKSCAAPLEQRVADLKASVLHLIEADLVNEAYEVTRQALPDVRIFVQPLITWRTMRSTPNATANATLRFLKAMLAQNHRPLHGQVLLCGELNDIHGVCGVPLEVDSDGWKLRGPLTLSPDEEVRLCNAAASIESYISEVRRAD